MKNGPEAPEFAKDERAFDGNGGGVATTSWSPSNSIALDDHAPAIETFGFNTKNPREHELERASRYRNRY